jgi:type IV secretory pathway VirD2 relaxase
MGPLGAHLGYLRREGVTKDGQPTRMFNADTDNADVGGFARRAVNDRHHFRFIISPEDGVELTDLHAYARDLARQMEQDLGTGLEWIAVDHWNTDNPHIHLIVRGKEEGGRDLVIHREYISRGLRARAQELATIELGPRTEHQVRARLAAEVADERWTQLDRVLQRSAAVDGIVDLRPQRSGPEGDRQIRGLLIGRLQRLEAMGLARSVGPGKWSLAADADLTLRELGIRGDVIRTMNRALGRPAIDAAIHRTEGPEQPVVGRIAAKGLDDELAGKPYVIVDGIDSRTHYIRFGASVDVSELAEGSIVRVAASRSGEWTNLRVLSDLPLEEQIMARGATWLDRELISRGKTPLAQSGFGAEVRHALDRRTDYLVQEGLATRRAGHLALASNLLGTLQRRELTDVAEKIAAESGFSQCFAGDGVCIDGIYRRRVTMASGRFALITNDARREFSLVPWRPEAERAIGKQVSVILRGGHVEWSFGRHRGLEIG